MSRPGREPRRPVFSWYFVAAHRCSVWVNEWPPFGKELLTPDWLYLFVLVISHFGQVGSCLHLHLFLVTADMFFLLLLQLQIVHPTQYIQTFYSKEKNENSIGKILIFLIFFSKHKLWVHVRTALPWCF